MQHVDVTWSTPDAERRDARGAAGVRVAGAREAPRVVPLRLHFSQERDVRPVLCEGRGRTIYGAWRATVSIRAVVDDAIVEFEATPEACESRVGPLLLTDGDRAYLRRLRADVDELLG